MNNKDLIIKKNFFKSKNIIKNLDKSFLIDANDPIFLEENDPIGTMTGIYFKLHLSKKSNDLYINLALYSWCNNKQTYVPLNESIWIEEDFGNGKYIQKIELHYENIVKNFLYYLTKFKYQWQLKEFIHKLENPTFIFHYKLLNTFSKDTLEKICLKYFNNYPVLNVLLLKKRTNLDFSDFIFLPHNIDGFYMNGIEVSTDLDENDTVVIEDDSKEISKEEFLNKINIDML